MPKLIVIAGPTASGKTSLAVDLAKHLSCPILSADSRQFYKEMSIGTAKPTAEEMQGVPHYFIDSHSIDYPLSSGVFEQEALEKLESIYRSNEYAILVGGSGMFIDALVFGIDQLPQDPNIREELNEVYRSEGLDPLLNELKDKDPSYYENVDRNNPVRIIRALEVIRITGKAYSDQRSSTSKDRPFETLYFVIDHDRQKLYDRINLRVDMMIEDGLIEEVKSLTSHRNKQPLNTVGYKEVFDHLDGEQDLDRTIELIKRNTRRYAKRQLTWFRRNKDSIWIPFSNNKDMIKRILQHLNS
tara:strand:- start:12478 stop:13377 length:900 start_codon:yes stop_codon:yes gene_type:complete